MPHPKIALIFAAIIAAFTFSLSAQAGSGEPGGVKDRPVVAEFPGLSGMTFRPGQTANL